VCQVPDYRKISGSSHAELVSTVYKFLMRGEERIPEDWFAKQVAFADRTDGDIDTLANRIAHIRTWTFVSNRPDWLKDPEHWQGRTRAIEDSLSDALHERLTQRFVDRRTSALMKGMRDKDELNADIADDGSITVENHFVGRLKGFCFTLDSSADGIHEKATRAAATQVLSRELGMRARRVAAAQNDAFKLTRNGRVVWRDDEIAKLEAGEDPLQPAVQLIVDEHISEPDKEKLRTRLQTWIKDLIADKLKPLVELSAAEDLQGLARGVAFRLKEGFGVLKRDTVADEINSLDQPSRASLRKYGLRFGAFNIYFPLLMKPAAAELAATLYALKHAGASGLDLDHLPPLPRPGLTSVATEPSVPEAYYRAYGFHLCGPRAVRLDILERLADLIRPLLAWRQNPASPSMPPKGATGDGGFRATEEMMSILGCSAEELGNVLKALGFRLERRPVSTSAAPAAATSGTVAPVADVTTEAGETALEAPADTEAEPAEAASAETVPVVELQVIVTEDAVKPPEVAEVPVAAATGAAGETEQKFEDIWRPRRHRPAREERRERGEGRRHHGGRHDGHRSGAAKPDDKTGDKTAAPVAEGDATPHRDAKPAAPGEHRHQRHDRGDRNRRQGGDNREAQGQKPREGRDKDRPSGDRRDGPRGGGGRPGGRDRDRQDRHPRTPEVITAAPPKRAGVDPDNPFAALLALKASMDKRGEGQGG
jgi:ATP-dependent RNA helicase SUPV3L1/SUV3